MNLETRHLRLARAITEEGSLTRAGERLHLSQSALSHQLLDLEEALGVRLFERTHKKMIPTVAGERLLQTAGTVLQELDQAAAEIRARAEGRAGVLRITTQCNTVYHWLPSRVRIFHRTFPNVDVEVVARATGDPFQFLREGKLDLALVHDTVRDRSIRVVPLFQDEVVVVLHPRHPLARKPWVQPEDLRDQHLISYTDFRQSLAYERVFRPANAYPARTTNVQLSEAILEMVKAGLGVGILARWSVAPHLRSGDIVTRALTPQGFHRQWSAAILRTAAPFVVGFTEMLQRYPIPVWRTPRQRKRSLRAMVNPAADLRRKGALARR